MSECKKLEGFLEMMGYQLSEPPEGGVIAVKGKFRFYIKFSEGLGTFDNGLD